MKTTATLKRRLGLIWALILLPLVLWLGATPAFPQPDAPTDQGAILLTIFLKHDQSKSLDEIQAHLKKQGFYQKFPPAGVELVSWYVMMGVGQVVTVRVPAEKLREVNLAIEHGGAVSH